MCRKPLGGVFILCLTSLTPMHAIADFDHTHALYGRVASTYVNDSQVDYAALKKNRGELDRYLEQTAGVAESEFGKWSDGQRLAFYINVYNAETLQLIIDYYPVSSIKDIGGWFSGPWDQEVVKLFGKTITLNNLEHDILRKQFDDARVHFALVCAARGCPPLRNEPYLPDRLDKQLDEQGKAFLGNPQKNRVDGKTHTVYLSPIFKWYRGDFEGKAGSVLLYIRPFLPEDARTALMKEDYAIRYTDYDWTLNERKAR